MSTGGQNFNNRVGHGVAATTYFSVGQYTLIAAAEVSLETVLAAIFTANSEIAWAPFEIRVVAELTGVEVRSKAGVSGFPLEHLPVAGNPHGAGLTLYPSQNATSPNKKILFKNTTAGNIILYAMLLG